MVKHEKMKTESAFKGLELRKNPKIVGLKGFYEKAFFPG